MSLLSEMASFAGSHEIEVLTKTNFILQTKKSDCFLEPDFKRERVSDIL
jgi:hypothetical protein